MLDNWPQARLVLFGHAHQEADQQHAGLRLLGTPSTCMQFAAGEDTFAVADLPPGYRMLELDENGDIETTVHYVSSFPRD